MNLNILAKERTELINELEKMKSIMTLEISKGIRSIVNFQKAMKEAGGFIKLWKSSMGLLQLKILAIVGVIALIVAGIIWLKKNWDNLSDTTKGFIILISTVAGAILGAFAVFKIISLIAIAPVTFTVLAVSALIIGLVILIVKNWDFIKEKTIKIWGNIKSVFSVALDIIKTVVCNFIDNVKDRWNNFCQFFSDILSIYVESAKEIWSGLKTTFSGIIDFITGIFTGNWQKAWDGVKNIFKGVFDSLVTIVKTPLNVIISLINSVIRGINSISSFKLPNFLGGKQISLFTIPEIPKLYKGTQHWSGGTAMIHDKGAEIVDLPNGSRVYPHDKSLQMSYIAGQNNGGSKINIDKLAETIIIREEADIDKFINKLVEKLELASINCV